MGVTKILLCEKDKGYGNALTAAISDLHNDFEVTVIDINKYCTAEEEYKAYLNIFDLILIGGYSPGQLKGLNLDKNKLVLLAEDPVESLVSQSMNEKKECWYLYKYLRISELAADLNFISTMLTGKKSYIRNNIIPNIIGFYSAGGGAGKTISAIATARELSRYHDMRVLYLSFEEINATELFIKFNPMNRSIGDYLYYLFEKQDNNLCSRLEAFTSIDEYRVETLYTSSGLNDLRFLECEELSCFLKTISDSSRYDYLIFDLDSDLSQKTLFILEQCSKIILVEDESPVSHYKNQKFITYIEKFSLIRSFEEMIIVVKKRSEYDTETDYQEDKSSSKFKRIYIEDDGNSISHVENHIEININNAFGVGIKKIADELLIPEKVRK
ncbi:MAG: hypothetical protein PHV71_07510 [Eubacteriales bacterium]|nr:hypothetical protein [Eubacteriales bacterium]MDD3199907.1 hypothetical protein [Eubacteriales bacterium]MDD4122368.1 hypothetical protein [Eubacteriales bacterium]MDD4630416.1 hypothetical protein [Eubacteriales bacterium]